ncbi:UNVERIFIED_CONTAM: hypothetical protein FKN15_073622 [Acipenser sinensis]
MALPEGSPNPSLANGEDESPLLPSAGGRASMVPDLCRAQALYRVLPHPGSKGASCPEEEEGKEWPVQEASVGGAAGPGAQEGGAVSRSQESGWDAYLSARKAICVCIICGDQGRFTINCPLQMEEEEQLLARVMKKGRSGHTRRQAKEPVPSPAPKKESSWDTLPG